MINKASSITAEDIKRSVDELFDEQIKFLQELVRFPSIRGNEKEVQNFIAKAMGELNLSVDQWTINIDDIRSHKGFSPVTVSYENTTNVVGTYEPKNPPKGKSLILNGHVDVVPTGDEKRWRFGPFNPIIEDGWMYGRGAGDMKAGVSANVFALKALQKLGVMPAARLHLESVVEEESTGNGALACLVGGYTADAGIIPEPLEPKLMRAQTGPIWIRVEVDGAPGHASGDFGSGADAIHNAIELIQSLDVLEERWNARKKDYPPFDRHPHPINFNVGRIEGGEWASSMSAGCWFEVRIAVYPGQDIEKACHEFEEYINEQASKNPFFREHPPRIIYTGFMAEGYLLENADEQEKILANSHLDVWKNTLEENLFAATTDARFTGLYGNCPTLVYGPFCKNPHGFDECVDLDSVRKVTQVIALFIAEWCGLEDVSK